MKHLFYIHSHLSKLVSELVIEYEGINKMDIVFLLFRNMDIKDCGYKVIKFPYGDESIYFKYHKNIFKSYRKLYNYSNFIDELTSNEPFFLYTPHVMKKVVQIIINKKKCLGYSILEEGSASYLAEEKLNQYYPERKVNLRGRIGYLGKIKNSKFVDSNYNKVYGLNKFSFPGYKRKINLSDNFLSYNDGCDYNMYEGSSIIVLDGTSIYDDVSQGINVYSIYTILEHIKFNKISLIFYKHHPSQYGTIEEKLYDKIFYKYRDKLIINKIKPFTSIESIMLNTKNLKIYISTSSIGIYGLVLGHKVYSTAKILSDVDSSVWDQMNMYPNHLLNKINYLKNELLKMRIIYYSPHPHLNLQSPSGYGVYYRDLIKAFEKKGMK